MAKKRANINWRDAVKRINAGEIDEVDVWRVLAKMDKIDYAPTSELEMLYKQVTVDRLMDVVEFCRGFREYGTKIGAYPY